MLTSFRVLTVRNKTNLAVCGLYDFQYLFLNLSVLILFITSLIFERMINWEDSKNIYGLKDLYLCETK